MKKILSILVAGLFLFGYGAVCAQNLDLAEFKSLADEQVTHAGRADAIKKLEQLEDRDKAILDDFMKKEHKKYLMTETTDPIKALQIYNQFKGAMAKSVSIYNPNTRLAVKVYQIVIPQ